MLRWSSNTDPVVDVSLHPLSHGNPRNSDTRLKSLKRLTDQLQQEHRYSGIQVQVSCSCVSLEQTVVFSHSDLQQKLVVVFAE
jgi:hypothetical protein